MGSAHCLFRRLCAVDISHEQWAKFPEALRRHLIERLSERSITLTDLNQLRLWVEANPEVPVGDWYKDQKACRGLQRPLASLNIRGFRGVSSNTCLQIFLIGWYVRNAVTREVLNELDALIRELQPTTPESSDSVKGAAIASAATANS